MAEPAVHRQPLVSAAHDERCAGSDRTAVFEVTAKVAHHACSARRGRHHERPATGAGSHGPTSHGSRRPRQTARRTSRSAPLFARLPWVVPGTGGAVGRRHDCRYRTVGLPSPFASSADRKLAAARCSLGPDSPIVPPQAGHSPPCAGSHPSYLRGSGHMGSPSPGDPAACGRDQLVGFTTPDRAYPRDGPYQAPRRTRRLDRAATAHRLLVSSSRLACGPPGRFAPRAGL